MGEDITPGGGRHGFGARLSGLAALAAAMALAGCSAAPIVLRAALGRGPPTALALPPIEIRGRTPESDTFAIIYSGDGGWSATDQGISTSLAQAGVPVAGVDSVRYFWKGRSPEAASRDLGRLIDHYAAAWGKSRVILIGYSFGADALPLMTGRLEPDQARRVGLLALLSPGPKGELVLRPRSWFNHYGPGAELLAPLLARRGGAPVVCIYGRTDAGALCPRLPAGATRVVGLPGGHRFVGQTEAVARAILAAAGA